MAAILNKLMDFIGIEETDMEEDYAEDYYEEPVDHSGDKILSMNNRTKKRPATGGSVVSLPTAAPMKMIVYEPVGYEDTQNIIDNLKSRKPVIVNMDNLELESAQRILDFLGGAVYALDGTINKIARCIFVVAPANCDVIGTGNLQDNGIF